MTTRWLSTLELGQTTGLSPTPAGKEMTQDGAGDLAGDRVSGHFRAALTGAPEFSQPKPAKPELEIYLDQIKHHLEDGGHSYRSALAQEIQSAREYIAHKLGELPNRRKPAIVLDVDETAISNWGYFETYRQGFSKERFDHWIASLEASEIEPTLQLFKYVRKQRVEVFFISSRHEKHRVSTVRLLRQVGYRGWKELRIPDPGQHR